MTDLPFQYLFQPRLNQLIIYKDFAKMESKYWSTRKSRIDNFKDEKAYQGEISKGGQKKLRRAIETLFIITPTRKVYNRILAKNTNFKLSHLTLTLPHIQGTHSDKTISKYCLQPFILNCKRKFGLQVQVGCAKRGCV